MSPRLVHSAKCRKIAEYLKDRKWCTGNGACGYTACTCDKAREARAIAHAECERGYDLRFRELGYRLGHDGKSNAAGHEGD
jgi:hypothetical protein